MNRIRKRKSLGQHFLKDSGHSAAIAEFIGNQDQWERVLEIGAGDGQLTGELVQRFGERLWVVELDARFAQQLRERFPELRGQVIEGSALDLDWAEKMSHVPFAVVGNYPYQISTEIVFKVLQNRAWIPETVGMFQREVAQRLAAAPGNKQYGITSVLTQVFYEVEYLMELAPEDFVPRPKVHSAVIRMIRRPDPLITVDYNDFRKVVKQAFNQRRKTLRNALKPLLSGQDVDARLLDLRAEQLGISDFEALTKKLMH